MSCRDILFTRWFTESLLRFVWCLRWQFGLRIGLEVRHAIVDTGRSLSLIFDLVNTFNCIVIFIEHMVLRLVHVLFSLLFIPQLTLAAWRPFNLLHTSCLMVCHYGFLNHFTVLFNSFLLHLSGINCFLITIGAPHR